MYDLIVSPKAQKELKTIKNIHQTAIKMAFEDIRENPTIGKPLTNELSRRFSYRVGVYRIIYKISEKDKLVYILTAGHRATVYK